jgi:hypothetical protein
MATQLKGRTGHWESETRRITKGADGIVHVLTYRGQYSTMEAVQPGPGAKWQGCTVADSELERGNGGLGKMTVTIRPVSIGITKDGGRETRNHLVWLERLEPLERALQRLGATQLHPLKLKGWQAEPDMGLRAQYKFRPRICYGGTYEAPDPNPEEAVERFDMAGPTEALTADDLEAAKYLLLGVEYISLTYPQIVSVTAFDERKPKMYKPMVQMSSVPKQHRPEIYPDGYWWLRTGCELQQPGEEEWVVTTTYIGMPRSWTPGGASKPASWGDTPFPKPFYPSGN